MPQAVTERQRVVASSRVPGHVWPGGLFQARRLGQAWAGCQTRTGQQKRQLVVAVTQGTTKFSGPRESQPSGLALRCLDTSHRQVGKGYQWGRSESTAPQCGETG